MFLPRSKCVICGENIPRILYNLKTTQTEKSKVLLIKFVENLYNNISFLHCNICRRCYDLLNEIDTIKQREKELYTQLKTFISKIENCTSPKKTHKDKNLNAELSSINSFNYEDLFDVDGVETRGEETDNEDISIPDVDLKKLPIKVKRVTQTSNAFMPTKKQLVTKQANDEAQNEKIFEQIQSAIQMDLSKHIVDHLTKVKPKSVLCEICGQNFKTKAGYENHMKKHEGTEDEMRLLGLNKQGPCFCDICGKCFNLKSSLSKHLIIHTGESRFQCDSCGKKFIHHSSFNMHKKIHAGERRFKCDICDHPFLTNSHLRRHIRATHDKERNYICLQCGKKFTEKYNLMAHRKIAHNNKVATSLATEVSEYVIVERAENVELEGTYLLQQDDVQEEQSAVLNL